MFVSLRLIDLPADRRAGAPALVAALAEAACGLVAPLSSWVAPVVEVATINCGQVVWRLHCASEAAALAIEEDTHWALAVAPLLAGANVTTVVYRPGRSETGATDATIWRALIFRIVPEGFPDLVRALEQQTLLMPRYIPEIRNWALSSVAATSGSNGFTHVWEQEFTDLGGLTGPYMTHPVHWALVDAWFDAESPDYIVDPMLIQVVAAIDAPVMAQGE